MTLIASPGGGRALGHDLIDIDMVPSGYWANCECGESFFGRFRTRAIDNWERHQDEEAQNRGPGV